MRSLNLIHSLVLILQRSFLQRSFLLPSLIFINMASAREMVVDEAVFLSLSCHSTPSSGSRLTINIPSIHLSPLVIDTILLSENGLPKDTLLTSVSELPGSIAVEFVNLETVSAFSFTLLNEKLKLPSFVLEVSELGSPGSIPTSHVFICQ